MEKKEVPVLSDLDNEWIEEAKDLPFNAGMVSNDRPTDGAGSGMLPAQQRANGLTQ